MRLKTRTLRDLAEMVTGGASGDTGKWTTFPYRSSSRLTDFFIDCDTEHVHGAGSRVPWTQDVLTQLNEGPATNPQLPADLIVRVVQELMDPEHYRVSGKDRNECLKVLNDVLGREGLQAYLDGAGKCHLRAGTTTSAGMNIQKHVWSQKDIARKAELAKILDEVSEDVFTEDFLVPLLQHCAFRRITVAGHKDKALEYGKDLWMKLQLPTGHFIYFAIQVKKGKIDAAGKTKDGHENIAEIMTQAKMALNHAVFDPDFNKRVLVDHIYIVASGEITKQAKQFMAEKLDTESRRQIIFMDREDLLTLAVQTGLQLPSELKQASTGDIPF